MLNGQAHQELRDSAGQDQSPFLVDTRQKEAIYESDDIIPYLEEHYE